MMAGSQRSPRYALSFTSGALLMREALIAAPLYLREHDWTKVRELIWENNLLQSRTVATGQRVAREVAQRLGVLTDDELELLVDATTSERGHLMWAAASRRYDLIGEFAEEVLRERFLTLAGKVTYVEFDSFYRSKAIWHDELDGITDSSYKKVRQVVFKMMVEAGLLSNGGMIEPAVPSARVVKCLNRRTPSDIRFFPTRAA